MKVNGSEINTREITEFWRMSKAYKVSRYDRLHWTAKRYHKAHPIVPNVRAYKAIALITQHDADWRL